MADRRKHSSSGDCHSSSSSKTVKRQISYATFQKWQVQYYAERKTLTWLHCDKDTGNTHVVSLLWCEVC